MRKTPFFAPLTVLLFLVSIGALQPPPAISAPPPQAAAQPTRILANATAGQPPGAPSRSQQLIQTGAPAGNVGWRRPCFPDAALAGNQRRSQFCAPQIERDHQRP